MYETERGRTIGVWQSNRSAENVWPATAPGGIAWLAVLVWSSVLLLSGVSLEAQHQIPVGQLKITPRDSQIKSYYHRGRLVKESELLSVIWAYASNYRYEWKWECNGCPLAVDQHIDVVTAFPRVSTNQVPQASPPLVPMGSSARSDIQVLGKCSTRGRKIRFTAYLLDRGQRYQTESAFVEVAGFDCPPSGPPADEEPPPPSGEVDFSRMASVYKSPR